MSMAGLSSAADPGGSHSVKDLAGQVNGGPSSIVWNGVLRSCGAGSPC